MTFHVLAFTTRTTRSKIARRIRGPFRSVLMPREQLFSTTSTTRLCSSKRNSSSSSSKKKKDIYDENETQLKASTKLSLAPMMDYTDRHFRYMMRLISGNTLLYSEMIAANALAHDYNDLITKQQEKYQTQQIRATYDSITLPILNHDDPDNDVDDWNIRRFLAQSQMYKQHTFHNNNNQIYDANRLIIPNGVSSIHQVLKDEGASVLQLGGSDVEQLGLASHIVANEASFYSKYTALNLNCGCPSPKVAGKGCFGAALMHDPVLVRKLTTAMYEGADQKLPITVKCRIGTDSLVEHPDNDDELYSQLCRFIETVASDDIVTDFQIHARIAVLGRKFSPAQNRNIPPLKYHLVQKVAQRYSPDLTISLNGGITTMWEAQQQFEQCPELAGIMIGRSMAAQPWYWSSADRMFWKDSKHNDSTTQQVQLVRNRWDLLELYAQHATMEERVWGTKIRRFVLRAIQSLFHGEPNAKKFRIALDEIGSQVSNKRRNNDSQHIPKHPLGDLVLDAAQRVLSEETLYRSRDESYDMAEQQEREAAAAARQKQKERNTESSDSSASFVRTSSAVQEWQIERKQEEEKTAKMT